MELMNNETDLQNLFCGEKSRADFKPSGRAAYDRFMRYRAELAKSGDLIFDQRHRLMCRTLYVCEQCVTSGIPPTE
jgi:hypothetical protein